MYSVLRSRSQRDYLLFKFAIHTGIKLSELNMSVQRLKSIESGNIKSTWIDDGEPTIQILLPSDLRNELQDYIEYYQIKDNDLVFSQWTGKGLSRQQAYRIINKAAEELDIPHIGLTTLRKPCISRISIGNIDFNNPEIFRASTTNETMKFIGIKDKMHNRTVIALNL